MDASRIKEGQTYMAVVRNQELLIKVDLVILEHVHGQVIETGRGISIRADKITAGPFKAIRSTNKESSKTRLSEKEDMT